MFLDKVVGSQVNNGFYHLLERNFILKSIDLSDDVEISPETFIIVGTSTLPLLRIQKSLTDSP